MIISIKSTHYLVYKNAWVHNKSVVYIMQNAVEAATFFPVSIDIRNFTQNQNEFGCVGAAVMMQLRSLK